MLPGILGTVHINNREPLSKTAALCFILSKKSFCGKMISEVFAGLFQKAADSKGRAFGRVPQDAKSSAFIKIRKGDAAARWVAASRETISRDFPMRREAAFVQAAAGKRVSRQTERAAAKEIVLRKNDTKGFRVRDRRGGVSADDGAGHRKRKPRSCFHKDQEGRRSSPVGCCVVGNPIKGFPDAA